jgi:hypothetical protein
MPESRRAAGEQAPARCEWCQAALVAREGPGRPRRFCRQSCRQQAYVARKVASAPGVGDHQRIVDRRQLEAAQDRIALLRQALADLEREGASGHHDALANAVDWLHAHAVEVADLRLDS